MHHIEEVLKEKTQLETQVNIHICTEADRGGQTYFPQILAC